MKTKSVEIMSNVVIGKYSQAYLADVQKGELFESSKHTDLKY